MQDVRKYFLDHFERLGKALDVLFAEVGEVLDQPVLQVSLCFRL